MDQIFILIVGKYPDKTKYEEYKLQFSASLIFIHLVVGGFLMILTLPGLGYLKFTQISAIIGYITLIIIYYFVKKGRIRYVPETIIVMYFLIMAISQSEVNNIDLPVFYLVQLIASLIALFIISLPVSLLTFAAFSVLLGVNLINMGDESSFLSVWYGMTLMLYLVLIFHTRLDLQFHSSTTNQLEKLRENYEIIFKHSPVGIVLTDRAKGNYLTMNQSYINMLGYSEKELFTMNYQDITHPDDLMENNRLLSELRSGKVNEIQFRKRYLTFEKNYIWVRVTVKNIDEFFIAIFEDIDDLVKQEIELSERKDQLDRLRRMETLSSFAGSILHDFNNLLMVITGNLELLELDSESKIKDKQEELSEIKHVTAKTSQFVNQLLSITKRELPLSQNIEINDYLRSNTDYYSKLIGRHIKLNFYPCESEINFSIHPSKFDQILVNLIANAKEAIGEVGTITIRTSLFDNLSKFNSIGKRQYLSMDQDLATEKVGLFSIEDNGKGMTEEQMDKLFTPFHSNKSNGHGLGLSIVFNIASRFQGAIYVTSDINQGSIFDIVLPISETKYTKERLLTVEKTKEAPKLDLKLIEGSQILLLEDNLNISKLISRYLQLHNVVIHSASSIEEVQKLLQNREIEFDLFISDILLDGEISTDIIRPLVLGNSTIPIILISGYSEIDIKDLVEMDQISFVSKPVGMDKLLELISIKLKK